jgi:hypothetical protein
LKPYESFPIDQKTYDSALLHLVFILNELYWNDEISSPLKHLKNIFFWDLTPCSPVKERALSLFKIKSFTPIFGDVF